MPRCVAINCEIVCYENKSKNCVFIIFQSIFVSNCWISTTVIIHIVLWLWMFFLIFLCVPNIYIWIFINLSKYFSWLYNKFWTWKLFVQVIIKVSNQITSETKSIAENLEKLAPSPWWWTILVSLPLWRWESWPSKVFTHINQK